MLLVRVDLEKIRKQSAPERFTDFPDMTAWVKMLVDKGNYIAGQPLAIEGRYVSKSEVLSDGPFIESKESVVGFDIVQVKDITEAVAIAQSCPMVQAGLAIREVRPMIDPVQH